MARPKKNKDIINNKRIFLRPSLSGMKKLKENASKANLPVATYTLQAALKSNVEVHTDEEIKNKTKEMHILSGIANNLNQLAKRANQEKSIEPILQELIITSQNFKNSLQRQ